MFDMELFLSAFAVLFVIIDPPGCAPIFATLTKGTSRKHQRTMAFKSVIVAAVILFGFAYGGEWIFAKLGISLDALRIAGGIMLFIIGLNMVFEKRTEKREGRAEDVLEEASGPGTMASLLILMGKAAGRPQELAILAALAAVLLVTLGSFLISGLLIKLMGKSVTDVLTRVLGVLLATLAAQFILDGIKGALF